MSHNSASSWYPPRIILASASPRRREMLQQLRIPFDVFVSSITEEWAPMADPRRIVQQLARRKVSECKTEDALVIGMDTLVACGKHKLGKPADEEDAIRMLKLLSGRMHKVVSGVALRHKDRLAITVEETKVYFRKLKQMEIDWYVKTGEPYDKAGAYAIQGVGRIFIRKIDGCYYNVVGFPLTCFQRALARLGFTTLDLMQSRPAEASE